MRAQLLKISLLMGILRMFRVRWINKGCRKACGEFRDTIKEYRKVIESQGKLHKRTVKSFVRWKNKKLTKEQSQLNTEIKRYQKLNRVQTAMNKRLSNILQRGIFEGARQKLVMDAVKVAAAKSYGCYDEFIGLQSESDNHKKRVGKKIQRIGK